MKALVLLLLVPALAWGNLDPMKDYNYCGPPKRDADGDIIRRADVLRRFQYLHPCPSTGLRTGTCPRWYKDHVRPLACGGCDAVFNLQWLDSKAKAIKDSYERRIYGVNIEDTDACQFRVTP